MEVLLILIGVIIGIVISFLYFNPKTKAIQLFNEQEQLKNQELKEEYQTILLKLNSNKIELETLQNQTSKIKLELKNLNSLKVQAEESAAIFYELSKKRAEENFENALELKSKEIQQATDSYLQEYNKTLEECALYFQEEIKRNSLECEQLQEILKELRSKVEAATEVNRRNEELNTKLEFYRLNISDQDLKEIAKLRSIIPELKNPEPLNKVIWKVYYENPYTDLVGRVVGDKNKIGIYKITNIKNQMCYVGQSVNIADRFKQHIKRGLGAETPTQNKLYLAMKNFGVENFTFEIIEECEKNKLNEREQFWQNFYQAKTFGYSIK